MTPDGPDEHEREEDLDDQARTTGADVVTEASVLTPQASVPRHLLRPVAATMTQAIVADIRATVPALDPEAATRRCQLLELAVRTAVRTFLDAPPDDASQQRKADELFRRLGYQEAHQGHAVSTLHAALHAASRCGWEHLSAAVADHCSAPTLQALVDAWFGYVDHVRDELLAGHALGSRGSRDSRTTGRARLLARFLRSTAGRISPLRPLGLDPVELQGLAEAAEWPVPERVVALAVSFHGEPPALPERAELLGEVRDGRVLVLCPEPDSDELAGALQRSGPGRRTAISWPVPAAEAGNALLWADRALDLVRLGVIAPTPLVHCAEHATQLWLHAEPSMRQHLCQALLEPLLAETPNSREILAETLLAWLETRDSAPAIAARLDVHPQTVRYRWKRINELFGKRLYDPEFVVQVTLVLKTSVLMWRAGHHSDFDRFRRAKGRA